MQNHSVKKCCFVGHRKIEITEELETRVKEYVEKLIVNENVKVFLFGSRSKFDDFCYDIVSKLKEEHPDIKRVYVRSQYEYIDEDYKKYLLGFYEETYFPEKCKGAGKISHVVRNQTMIDDSDFCLFYYDENYLPPQRKWSRRDLFAYQPNSGTATAYKYAKQKKKIIYNFFIYYYNYLYKNENFVI